MRIARLFAPPLLTVFLCLVACAEEAAPGGFEVRVKEHVEMKALQEGTVARRIAALEALSGSKSPEAVAAMRSALVDADARVRAEALTALSSSVDGAPMAALCAERFTDDAPAVRRVALACISRLGDDGRRRAREIAALLRDPDLKVRVEAVSALGWLRAPGYETAADAYLQHEDMGVRTAASIAHNQLTGKDLQKQEDDARRLLADLRSGDVEKRREAVWYIHYDRELTRRIRGELVGALESEDPLTRRNAALALAAKWSDARGESYEELRRPMAGRLTDADAVVRSAAIAALASFGNPADADVIAERLLDPAAAVRESALRALATMRATRLTGAMAALLRDVAPEPRIAAADALAQLGARRFAGDIAKLVTDADTRVQAHAARALRALDAPFHPRDLFVLVKPAIVHIEVHWETDRGAEVGSGSGAIVDPRGLVLTNGHVVGPMDSRVTKVLVTFADGRRVEPASTFYRHPSIDIACLLLPDPGETPYLALHLSSHDTGIGDDVFVIGHPLGLDWSLSSGRVSAFRTEPDDSGLDLRWLQTDAPISPGNSGGPVFNAYGQIVGIATKKYAGGGAEGLAFAISDFVADGWVDENMREKIRKGEWRK